MRLRHEIKASSFLGRICVLIQPRKLLAKPSEIGPSMHKSDASQVCALKTRVNAHGQCTHFYVPYHLCFLVVSSIHPPLLSVGSEGEGVTGATPLFCGSCGARHPFQLTLRVSRAALPGGGRSRLNNPCGKARIPEADRA